jgi:hypothetical protein
VSQLALLAVLVIATGLPGAILADQPKRAGLLVQFDDGRVETRCVEFETDEISGADLLTRSGLAAVVDVSTGLGITVCKIEGLGCDYPAEHCFCQCMSGAACGYWNYFTRDPGETQWTYSALGAVLHKSRSGSVEAWAWGDGHTPPDDDWTFERICPAPTPTATDTPTPIPATATLAPAQSTSPAPSPTAVPTATTVPPTPVPASVADAGQSPGLLGYWPFALMVVILAGMAVWVRLRRR